MPKVLIVPDLPVEHWPSMDRYALRLVDGLAEEAPGIDVTLASPISPLTAETDESSHAAAGESDRSEVRRHLARYWSYPRRIGRHRADLVHVLDHSYAHTLSKLTTVPSLVTVHDLLPVITLQRKSSGLRDAIRNRLLEWVLDQLRRASG